MFWGVDKTVQYDPGEILSKKPRQTVQHQLYLYILADFKQRREYIDCSFFRSKFKLILTVQL